MENDPLEPYASPALTEEASPSELQTPALWNPTAAALWSIVFTPILGAYLHASNWRVLGDSKQARANMIWFWASTLFIFATIGLAFLPDSPAIDTVTRAISFGLLIGWYVTLGKLQVGYVRDVMQVQYVKKSWLKPLVIGVLGVAGYFAIMMLIATVTFSADPQELAAEVKPLILAEFQKKPALKDATIEKIKLEHQHGDVYTGYIDIDVGETSERLDLTVTDNGETITWKLKDPKP